jgi:hypothetical protein
MARLGDPVEGGVTRADHAIEIANRHGSEISIARCRELLGEEADSMTDQDVTAIRRHAETMAWILVEMYEERGRTPE